MDQTPVKLRHLVTGSNKELRKIQIPWTFRTPSWYYYKVAQDMYDPVHSQSGTAWAHAQRIHMALEQNTHWHTFRANLIFQFTV